MTMNQMQKSRNYMEQLLLRERDCKHHSIKLNRRHTFSGFETKKLYEFPDMEEVHMFALSDKLLYVLGKRGGIVAIDREQPEIVYTLREKHSDHIRGEIYYDERTESLLSYVELYEEEDSDFSSVAYYQVPEQSILDGYPGILTLYTDTASWQFDIPNRLILADYTYWFEVLELDDTSTIVVLNTSTRSNLIMGRPGNSTFVQYNSNMFIDKDRYNELRVYKKRPFEVVIRFLASPGIEIIQICEMYLVIKREGFPLLIFDLKVEYDVKPICQIQTNIYNVEKSQDFIGLCRTQQLLIYLEGGGMGVCDLQNGNLKLELHDPSRHPPSKEITKWTTYITNDEDVIITTDLVHQNQGEMLINISNLNTGQCLGKITCANCLPGSNIKQKVRKESLTKIVALTYDINTNEIFTGNVNGGVFIWTNN